ncbi:LysR family transcriptional regulator [Sedimentitalea sp. CY04]|uniref:LysR family transcriptional regulator n=1 Tax=Parasedimentitalea denitrificans TaxID=2211118 RepID=A0ABX0WFT8_9RHOB|nr:LysR family transcriptional regulator [Sedimentitalea sp. CY04]NIZ63226.1 LysR family transcriptional regulator [Sedimentitalea sp. CY04]
MNDWDDLRFFLAVARKGSIRGAAGLLGVNHSTVSRRIDAFEKKLGTRLFERLPSGYLITQAGEEMSRSAAKIEAEFDTIGRQVTGRDTQLDGVLKVSLHNSLADKLLMPLFVEFQRNYPEIELDFDIDHSMADLSRREADVAIRISNDPPDSLVGRRVVRYATSTYASLEYLERTRNLEDRKALAWIGWYDPVPDPQWIRDSQYPDVSARNHICHPLTQLAAAKAGMGLAMLPCFMADTEPDLRRVPNASINPSRDVWVLTHEDLRHTARVRHFTDFMVKGILAEKDLLEGKCPHEPCS